MAELESTTVRDWQVVRLTTDQLVLEVVPALGATVLSLRRRSDDLELLWRTPWGLRHRGAVPLPGSSEAMRVDSFPGGWQTLFPNGGDTATVYGVEWAVDGEARIAPFDWRQTPDSLIMTARLVRSPFEVTKIISLHDAEVTLQETVHNVGGEAVEIMWGSQLIFGSPLLSEHTTVDAGAAVVRPDPLTSDVAGYDDIMPWPRTLGQSSMINLRAVPTVAARETRLAYLTDFGTPHVRIHNPDRHLSVDLTWDKRTWPHLWYSLEAGGVSGFPWYRSGYFLALTPCTSWPAHGLHDARYISQSTRWVDPGTSLHAQLTVRVDGGSESA
jgi:hypothetical protein